MFVLGNMVAALATILHYSLTVYMWIVIIRCLLSWVNPDPYNPIVVFLYRITDPVLSFVRRKLPFTAVGAFDLSPIVVVLSIWFLNLFLYRTLTDISIRLH
ncbi:MAG: YggT family protein [Syntrophobacterales bacterium]|jgi:YggT family protein|nr:YggT family protein [Syntrophobacterales bacterium]